MIPLAQAGLTVPAVAGRLERGVRPHAACSCCGQVPEPECARVRWCRRCVEQFGSHGEQLSALRSTSSHHAGLECQDASAAFHFGLEKHDNIARLGQRLRVPRCRQVSLCGSDLNCVTTCQDCKSRVVVQRTSLSLTSSKNGCSCGNGSKQRPLSSHWRGCAGGHDSFRAA
jgi:hypothetical protein